MKKSTSALLLLATALAVGLLWLLTSRAAIPDAYSAVAGALRQARPADVESITCYPLLPDRRGRPARPFQLRTAATIAPLLRALRPVAVNKQAFSPLVETTVMVRLRPALADAWHLHSGTIIWRLALAAEGDVALRAFSPVVCQSSALNRQVRQLRDSVDARRSL